jgi:DNA-binding response OmpR family regulator
MANRPKIMVVDDDEEFTTMYKEYLRMAGFDAVSENESSKALELAHAEKPDVFVLDLMMPKPDGFQLCRMLRADPNFRHTPVIIVTALTDLDSQVVAMGAGASDYLTKPFHIEELKSRINALLERTK